MLQETRYSEIAVTLPDDKHFLKVPIKSVFRMNAETIRADVEKDGGDDPDNTHGAIIFVEVRKNAMNEIGFFAGKGVGTITQPGLRLAIGEPAINPVPRQMMQQAVAEVLKLDDNISNKQGFDLTIGCENGESIAKKTFNPRLGIVGGISILGTTGIVEPLSLDSWIASIEVYIRVALGKDALSIAILPGKIGRTYAAEQLELPKQRVVQIANFLGNATEFTQYALEEQQRDLDILWLLGHPGKLAKLLDGVWDTHSRKSNMAMSAVAKVAADIGFNKNSVNAIVHANTVEAVIEMVSKEDNAQALWQEVERRIAAPIQERLPSVKRVEVRLFNLRGKTLGTT